MQICSECKCDISNSKLKTNRGIFNIPFSCLTCGAISLKYRPTRDLVFLWRYPAPEKIGMIYLPDDDNYLGGGPKKRFSPALAIVLAIGRGYNDKSKGFVSTHTVEIGDVVLYNKNVPWSYKMENSRGDRYTVTICGFEDIHSIVSEPKSDVEYLL